MLAYATILLGRGFVNLKAQDLLAPVGPEIAPSKLSQAPRVASCTHFFKIGVLSRGGAILAVYLHTAVQMPHQEIVSNVWTLS